MSGFWPLNHEPWFAIHQNKTFSVWSFFWPRDWMGRRIFLQQKHCRMHLIRTSQLKGICIFTTSFSSRHKNEAGTETLYLTQDWCCAFQLQNWTFERCKKIGFFVCTTTSRWVRVMRSVSTQPFIVHGWFSSIRCA